MIRVALITLRADWRLWVGPLIVTSSTGALISLVATYWVSMGTAQASGVLASLGRTLDEVRSTSYVLYIVIALSVAVVLSSNTVVTIRAQRHTLATLRLAGARPRQIHRSMILQVLVVALIGSTVGFLLALPFAQSTTDVLVRMSTRSDAQITATANVVVFLATVLCTLVVCWVAALRPARIASKSPAVAAVRAEPEATRRMGVARWVGFGFATVTFLMVLIGAVASVFYVTSLSEAFAAGSSNAITLGLALIAMTGFIAPALLPLLIRTWTGAVPGGASPSWYLARQSALHRFALSSTTIVPLLIGFSLFGVIFGSVATWSAALDLSELSEPLNTLDTYVILTPVALITGIGSITNLFMTGRGRERELALVRTAGATPSTIRRQVAWEALIYVVTAMIVALVVTALTVLVQSVTFALSGGPFAPRIDLLQLAILVPIAYIAMLIVVAIPARSASHRDLRSILSPA